MLTKTETSSQPSPGGGFDEIVLADDVLQGGQDGVDPRLGVVNGGDGLEKLDVGRRPVGLGDVLGGALHAFAGDLHVGLDRAANRAEQLHRVADDVEATDVLDVADSDRERVVAGHLGVDLAHRGDDLRGRWQRVDPLPRSRAVDALAVHGDADQHQSAVLVAREVGDDTLRVRRVSQAISRPSYLDHRVLKDDTHNAGCGHHIDDGEFGVPAVQGGEGAERD